MRAIAAVVYMLLTAAKMPLWPNCVGMEPLKLLVEIFNALRFGNMLVFVGRLPLHTIESVKNELLWYARAMYNPKVLNDLAECNTSIFYAWQPGQLENVHQYG